ncbi:cupin domain-containing protein [Pseudonocardia sp. ICBG1122]|nr:cupin domain-containing protein [Pseudonocardia pini]
MGTRTAKLASRVVGWEQIPAEEVRPGISRRTYATDDVMLVRNVVEYGHELRPHHHEFDQLVYIDSGRCDYVVDGVAHPMGPGDLLLVPARAEHYIAVTEGPCTNIDLFTPPRTDIPDLIDGPERRAL